jgi:ribA/ribD-fused uncharacterized protein
MTSNLYNLESLRSAVRVGARPKYLFFWGHTASASDLGKECFSQWFPAPFQIDGRSFATAEHYMMFRKAMLFGDAEVAERILSASSPGAAKALGRSVRNFDEALWVERRSDIVVDGNLAKFSQSSRLTAYLLATKDRVLVEASPVDRIWGVGLSADDEHIENPERWRGLNLLGFALMRVREHLRQTTDVSR